MALYIPDGQVPAFAQTLGAMLFKDFQLRRMEAAVGKARFDQADEETIVAILERIWGVIPTIVVRNSEWRPKGLQAGTALDALAAYVFYLRWSRRKFVDAGALAKNGNIPEWLVETILDSAISLGGHQNFRSSGARKALDDFGLMAGAVIVAYMVAVRMLRSKRHEALTA